MQTVRSRSYVGIDPSFTSTGIAIITYSLDQEIVRRTRRIKTSAKQDETERLLFLRDSAHEFIIESRKSSIIGSAIEGPSLYSVNQADKLGEVRGVLRVLLADLGEELPYAIPPTSLKKFATGNGGAKKERMISEARKQWGVLSEDEADAAWLAELAAALYESPPTLTRKQLEAIHGIRKMSQLKPKAPAGGREINI